MNTCSGCGWDWASTVEREPYQLYSRLMLPMLIPMLLMLACMTGGRSVKT